MKYGDADDEICPNCRRGPEPEKKVFAWYVKGIGGFYLNYETIPEAHKKLGLIPLVEGESDV